MAKNYHPMLTLQSPLSHIKPWTSAFVIDTFTNTALIIRCGSDCGAINVASVVECLVHLVLGSNPGRSTR